MGLISVAADAAKAAGFTGDNLVTAVAIAGAESGWVSSRHNSVPPDNSYGLWQINMYGALGPTRRKLFGITSNDALFNPVTNAKCAWVISNHGTNFRPWTTYTSGKYKEFLPQAQDTVKNPPKTGLVSVGVDPNGPIASVPNAISAGFTAFTGTLTKVFGNVSIVVIAVVLLAIGVLILMRSQVGTVVAATTPVGKAASVIGGVATVKANPDVKAYTGSHRK